MTCRWDGYYIMERILCEIVKMQNKELIKRICTQYGKDEDYMMRMYNTPTFYKPEVSNTKKSTALMFSNS